MSIEVCYTKSSIENGGDDNEKQKNAPSATAEPCRSP